MKHSINQSFKSLLAILLCLFVKVSTLDAAFNIGDIVNEMQNLGPDDYYYVQMVAQPSPAASGTVQLMWIDMMGDTINANDFSEGNSEKAKFEYMFSQLNPGASGNANPTGYVVRPQLTGVTVLYGDMEAPLGSSETHVYITSFAYFKAEAKPADGWYFDGWTYSDNGQVTMLTELRQGNNILWPTEENPNTNGAVIFKVKPHNVKGMKYLDPNAVESVQYDSVFRYVQAVFKPVLLTGYRGGKSEIVVGEENVTFDVYVLLDAKKTTITPADFEMPTFDSDAFSIVGMEGGYNAEIGAYAKVRVKFTAPEEGIAADIFYKAKMRAASKGGSVIDIPLEVRAVAAERSEATLFNADKSIAYDGNLLQAVKEISAEGQVLRLNKNVSALPLKDKNVTLDMNGYTISSLAIDGGVVTVKYNKYDEGVENPGSLEIKSGKAILNGGTFSSLIVNVGTIVEQNGATITGSVINNGTLTTNEGSVKGGIESKNGVLTINGGTFRGDNAVTISGGTAYINKGTIVGTAYGVNAIGGTTIIEKYAAIDGGTKSVYANGGTVTINNGMFGNELEGTLTLKTGYFKNENVGVALPDGKQLMNVAAGPEFEEGFIYFVGNAEDALASNVGVCRIGSTPYARLEDAIAYANNNPDKSDLVILMTNHYTLPAGYYTLPANATIVVPMSDDQTNSNAVVRRTVKAYIKPSEFRRLTFASGVKMEVFGKIEVSCTQHAYDTGNGGYNSNPWGPYGHLVLEEGTKLTLQNGSHIYAWGYITGKGEIDARRGSTVHEMFQMGDWKGGTTSAGMLTDSRGVFPVTQYWIQNVEVPAKFHPGSVLTTAAAVSVLNGMVLAYANDINIVGVYGVHDAMFLLDNEADAENTWVYKRYDNENDLQVYDVNNTAHIGSIVLKLGKLGNLNLDMNSAVFKLPITNNMKIHLLSGFMDFTQDTYLLPGAMVEVDKESIVTITTQSDPDVHSGALYLYDADDWGNYIIDISEGQKFTKAVLYEPVIGGRPAVRPEKKEDGQKDATILVHGQFDTADGYVYTSTNGANICSTNEDAGTFTFSTDVPSEGENYTAENYHADGTSIYGTADNFTVAKLRNAEGADPAWAETGGTKAGQSYCYMNDKWTLMTIDPDNGAFMREYFGGDVWGGFYIKPAEYVEVTASKDPNTKVISGNGDNTFSDAAGEGRLFIKLDTKEGFFQWWEVEKKDNLYHCTNPDNDTYYFWVDEQKDPADPEAVIPAHWEEKRFNITWKNWDGTIIQTGNADGDDDDEYSVTYGTMAEFLGTNPTRKPDIDYTYDFTGWSPELAPVTSNVTYTATYEKKERKYTITFLQEGGVEIERQFLPHNAVPVCENTPTKIGHTLVWSPAIAAVTGDATYTATWKEEPPTEYEVTFYDYDGTTLLQQSDVNVGDKPTPPVIEDGKPVCDGGCESGKTSSTGEFTYVFDHWSPEPEVVSATSVKSYVAVYREVPKKYTIYYFMEDGETPNPTKPSEELPYGATPTPPAVSKENPEAGYTYTLVWKTLDESGNIETIRGTASYKPTYEREENRYNRFTVTLATNIPEGCMLRGAGTYDDGDNATIEAMPVEGYGFVRWEEDGSTENPRTITVSTDDVSYTAIVRENKTVAIGDVFNADGDIVNDLILESNGSASGQITNATALTVEGNAYFDLTLNANAETWYAFGLPWQVSTDGGMTASGQKLTIGQNCFILEYDGAAQAAGTVDPQTGSYWHYVANGATLLPAKLYMIYLRNAATTIRFAKAAGAELVNTTITLEANSSDDPTADPTAAGWNAIANPTTYYAQLTTDAIPTHKGQAYVPGVPDANGNTDTYMPVDLTSDKLIVGQPLFVQVQVSENKSVVANTSNVFFAPRRMPQAAAEYEVRIAPVYADFTDRLYISASDDKEDKYIIGQDLSKISVATGVAQMWINRYDTKLCANVTEVMNDQAVFPMGIYAPKDGQYTLSTISTIADNEELYVTIDGTPVWDLATGAYTIDLQQGNTSEYGLVIVRRPAPEVTTGCQNVEASENASVRKVLINGQVFILRDGAVYTIFGQKAK